MSEDQTDKELSTNSKSRRQSSALEVHDTVLAVAEAGAEAGCRL